MLRLFLEEEEKARLKVLRQERDIKTQVMSEKLNSIEAQIDKLSSTIVDCEAALREKDLPFLQVILIKSMYLMVGVLTDLIPFYIYFYLIELKKCLCINEQKNKTLLSDIGYKVDGSLLFN